MLSLTEWALACDIISNKKIFGVNPILLPGDLEVLGGFGDFPTPSAVFTSADFVDPDLLSGPISFCNILRNSGSGACCWRFRKNCVSL